MVGEGLTAGPSGALQREVQSAVMIGRQGGREGFWSAAGGGLLSLQ